jgi:ribosomal protein S12 methylthiotransferase
MTIQQRISLEKNRSRVGNIYEVIVDGASDDGLFYVGRSYAEAPESDGVIYFAAKDELEIGSVVQVKILVADEYDLTGEQV